MADIKSLQTLVSELVTYIRARNAQMDTSENSLTRDIILNPYGVGGKLIMDNIELVKNLHILSDLDSSQLVGEGGNYKLTKYVGTYATVVLTFWATSRPTSDVVIAASTQARTSGTLFDSPITFSTRAEYTFSVNDMEGYYSHDRDRYEFSVTATCDTLGSSGRSGSGLVNTLVSTVDQIDGVTNLVATVGGIDQESDEDFRERIRLKKIGKCLNVHNGIRQYLRSLGFLDANIIRVEQSGYERATGVDCFVIDSSVESASEIFTYDPAQERYYITNRPLLEVTSVVANTIGQLDAAAYDVTVDSTSPLRRSTLGQDYIEFTAPSLAAGTLITVTYNYASAVKQAQDNLDLTENEVLTADLLIKRAYPVYLFLTASLTLKANADGPTTRNKVRNALSQFASEKRLGDNLQKSDIVLVMQQGYGDYPVDTVDAVVISEYYLADEFNIRYDPVDETISTTDKQYILFGSATLT